MSIRIKISILWLWIGALLSATVGISVHQIYCYCVGKTTYSVFDEAAEKCVAAKSPVEKACCKKEAPSCCSAASNKRLGSRDCTQKSVKVFILKAEFLVTQPLEHFSFDYPIWADEFPEYLKLFRPVVCDATVCNKAPPVPPPPLSGRNICLRHELFRC